MDRATPSRALRTCAGSTAWSPAWPAASFALGSLDLLPLAVDIACRLHVRVAEDVRVAADDLAPDLRLDVGHVEHAGLGRKLGVEDDLQQQVTELARKLRRGFRRPARRNLVRFLEQVLSSARRGSVRGPMGSRRGGVVDRRSRVAPGAGRGQLGRHGARYRAPANAAGVSSPTVAVFRHAEPADEMLGRVDPGQHGESRLVRWGMRPGRGGTSPSAGAAARRTPSGTTRSGRDGSTGTTRGAPERRPADLRRHPGPANAGFGDERVEHVFLRGATAWPWV